MARKLSLRKCAIEVLESRCFLSAQGVATPQFQVIQPAAVTNPDSIGFTPAQIRAAYGFDQVAYTGAGQTIAIIDAYNDPKITADVATFSRQFGLPQFNVPGGPTFRVESQTGSTTALPRTDADWSEEIALDVEWAHAIAPAANILLVEANTDNFPDLLMATNHAKVQPAVSVISMSWDGDEFSGETSWDPAFLARKGHIGQTFVAAAGDDGSPAEWPAVSPFVLSVGGTSLTLADGAYASESGWSDTSGGVAQFENEPSFQRHVQSTGFRAAPDVAYDGDPDTGVAVYNSVPSSAGTGWAEIGGTSEGAPQWAALIALADQGRALRGLGTLSNAQSILYTLPATDYHDVTLGTNGGYPAGPGYDAVTGLGTPLANLVIQHLVGGVPPGAGAPVSDNTGVVNSGVWIARDPLPGATAATAGPPASVVAMPFASVASTAVPQFSVVAIVTRTEPSSGESPAREAPTLDVRLPAGSLADSWSSDSQPVDEPSAASVADTDALPTLDAGIGEGLEKPPYIVSGG